MTKEEIGAKLKAKRISCGMTQQEVADKIGRKQPIVGHWETGYSQPDANTLFILCDLYGTTVDDVFGFKKEHPSLSKRDKEVLKKYNDLDSFGKETIDIALDRETNRVTSLKRQKERIEELEKEPLSNVTPMRFMSYYQRMASAGSGEYLFDDIPTDLIEVEDTPLSRKADFVLGVNGHSMEPTYYDGDNVLVRKTSDVPIGHIGIFIKGSNCYIKELGEDRLISHNEDKDTYPDIYPDDEPISIVGEVLGKV